MHKIGLSEETIQPGKIRKTIVFTANTSFYLHNFRKRTIQEFIALGYEVVIICGDNKYMNNLSALGARCTRVCFNSGSLNLYHNYKSLLNLFRTLSRNRGIVFSFTPKMNIFCSFICAILRIPHVPNISGQGQILKSNHIMKFTYSMMCKYMSRNSYHVFFQNRSDALSFQNNFYLDEKKITLLPGSGVDLRNFTYVKMPPLLPFKVLLMARLLKSKGVPEYLELARRHKKNETLQFLLAGPIVPHSTDAVVSDDIKEFTDEGSIVYLGEVDDPRAVIADCHVCMLPTTYGEGAPKTLLEGLAIGRAIITSNMPGCMETVRYGNGYVLEDLSVEAMDDSLTKLRNLDYQTLAHLGSLSRKLAEQVYDEVNAIQPYLNIVNKIYTEEGVKFKNV